VILSDPTVSALDDIDVTALTSPTVKASDVIEHFGSATKAAEAIGVTRSAVSQWLMNEDRVPELRAYQIERLTGGALKAAIDTAAA